MKRLLLALIFAACTQAQLITAGFTHTLSTPVDSPGAGTYSSTQSVTITDAGSSLILYTTDGSTPACPATGTLYSGAFNITVTTTLKAIGCAVDGASSGVLTSVYTITGASAPTVVQDTYGGPVSTFVCASTTTCSTVSINVTAGNGLSVFVADTASGSGSPGTVSGVTDTCGTSGGASDTYTSGPTAHSGKGAAFFTIIGATKACVITAADTNAGAWLFIYAQEISGINGTTPVVTNQWAGNYQLAPGAGTDVITSGSLASSTTQTNTLLSCVNIDSAFNGDTWTVGTGQTSVSTRTDSISNLIGSYRVLASSGVSTPCTGTASGGASNIYYSFGMVWQHP